MQSKNGGWPQRLYVIGEPGYGPAKIGIAERPLERLRALRATKGGTLIAPGVRRKELQVLYSQPGGRPVELALHQRFSDLWIMGEWFRLGADPVAKVREAIDDLYDRGVIAMNSSSAVTPPLVTARRQLKTQPRNDGKLVAAAMIEELLEQQRRAREVRLCPPKVLNYTGIIDWS